MNNFLSSLIFAEDDILALFHNFLLFWSFVQVTKDDILTEMRKVTEGVMDVIVYPSASDKTKNRGFAFVEYESHRSAAMARRKLMNGRVDLWGHNIAVDWAEPELEVDADIMAQVRARDGGYIILQAKFLLCNQCK